MYLDKFVKAAKDIEQSRKRGDRAWLKKGTPAHDDSNWLISYADMMTLLCGFFIMMFCLASLNVPKYRKVSEEIAKHFNGETSPVPPPAMAVPTAKDPLITYISKAVQDLGISQDAIVSVDKTGINIVFQSTVFFETSRADLTERGQAVLLKLSEAIRERQSQEEQAFRMVVEGHTDSRPINTAQFPSNWELSGARAARVVRLFLEDGFLPDQLMAVGYADTRPFVDAPRSPAGDAKDEELTKNRRVVIRLLHSSTEAIPWNSYPEAPHDEVGTGDISPSK